MCDPERQRIINEAARILTEIRQIFIDTQSWNDNARLKLYPDEPPIDPDPDGKMGKLQDGLVAMLQREASLENFPTIR